MTEPFDPSISSSDYLALARARHRAGTSRLNEDLAWMLDDDYTCGLNQEHVDVLIYPANWSSAVRYENRKPRAYLHARVNQKGNAEINWARGDHEVVYDEDFLARYVSAAQSAGSVPWRGIGELMWWKGFEAPGQQCNHPQLACSHRARVRPRGQPQRARVRPCPTRQSGRRNGAQVHLSGWRNNLGGLRADHPA